MYSLRLNLFREVLTGAGIPLSLQQMFCCRLLSHHGAQTPSSCHCVLPSVLCGSDLVGLSFLLMFFPVLHVLLASRCSSTFWLSFAKGIFLLLCNGSELLPLSRGVGRSFAHTWLESSQCLRSLSPSSPLQAAAELGLGGFCSAIATAPMGRVCRAVGNRD